MKKKTNKLIRSMEKNWMGISDEWKKKGHGRYARFLRIKTTLNSYLKVGVLRVEGEEGR